jgi:hypothetical protein
LLAFSIGQARTRVDQLILRGRHLAFVNDLGDIFQINITG